MFRVFSFIALILSILFIAYALTIKETSFVWRTVISFILSACLHQLLGMLFWVLHIPLSIPVVVIVQLTIGVLLLKFSPKKEKTVIFETNDLISLLVTACSILTILIFVFKAGINAPTLLRFSIPSIDDTVHINLIMANYENRGYIYGSQDSKRAHLTLSKFISYPQGWHLDTSLWWHSINRNLSLNDGTKLTQVTFLYGMSKLMWYGLIIFIMTKLILHLVCNIAGKINGLYLTLMSSILVGFIQLLWLLQLLDSGFISYMPQIINILLLVYFSFQFYNKKISIHLYTVSSSLLIAGLSLTWLLTVPIGLLIVLLVVVTQSNDTYRNIIKQLVAPKNILSTLLSFIILIIGFLQVIIQLKYSSGSSINEGGGIFKVPESVYIFFILSTALLLFTARENRAITNTVLATLTSSLLPTGLLYLYQITAIDEPSYYFYKLSWITLTLLSIYFCVIVIYILYQFSNSFKLIPTSITLISLLLAIVMLLKLQLPGAGYLLFGWSALGHNVSQNILNNTRAIRSNSEGSSRHIVIASGNAEEDVVAYFFILNTLNHKYKSGFCNIPVVNKPITKIDNPLVFDQFVSCPTNQKYIIFAGSNYSYLVSIFKGNHNITVLR
ncbi:hypothetical protein KC974_04085 [Candidatus Saccharibacteria bacterium]|nr:hypothetical protein [Candidatus Saccharibacteria bacterium]